MHPGDNEFGHMADSRLPVRVDELGHMLDLPVMVDFSELLEPARLEQYLKGKTQEVLRLVGNGHNEPIDPDSNEPAELIAQAVAHYCGEQRPIAIRVAGFSPHDSLGTNIMFALTHPARMWLAHVYPGFNPDAHEAYVMAWHTSPSTPVMSGEFYRTYRRMAIVMAQECERLDINPLVIGQTLLHQERFMR